MKKTKTVYISLPITGRDMAKVKETEQAAIKRLHALGYHIDSPLIMNIPSDATHERAMRTCLKWMLDCDAVYFCDGYLGSKGCLTESMVAQACGLKQVYYVQTDEEIIKELER